MENKIGNININRDLLNFLFDIDDDMPSASDEQTTVAVDAIDKEKRAGAISNHKSLELLRYELDLLYHQFFTRTKICLSLSELLAEIESPNEDSNLAELKELVYSELRCLAREEKELFAVTHKEEVKWLKQLAAKAIGPKDRKQKKS